MADEQNKDKKNADQKTADAVAELAKLEAELKAKSEQRASESRSSSEHSSSQSTSQSTSKVSRPSGSKQTSSMSNTRETKGQTHTVKATGSRFSWLALFAFLFSLVAIAGAAYLYWLMQTLQSDNQAAQEQAKIIAQQSLLETRNTVETVQDNLTALQRNQQNSNDFVLDTQRHLQSLNARIKELGQSQPNTWLAAESLYLVNLAERRLAVEQDVNSAIQLLVDANLRLDAMNDPSVFYLREAISVDLAMLANLPSADTESVYLSLSGLISQADTLPLAHIYVPEPVQPAEKQEVSDNASDWKENLKISFQRFFGNFVKVTRRETAVEPELPPKQRWFVRTNVQQQLTMAQHAALKGQQAIYNDALSKVEKWIKQYFDITDVAVVSTLNTLSELQRKPISVSTPTELTAQPLLNKYVVGQIQLQQQQLKTQQQDTPPKKDQPNEVTNG